MRRILIAACFVVAAASSASATIVNFSSSPSGRSAVDSSLVTLPNGDQFLVGTFSSPASISLSLGSVSNILGAGGWSQFDGAQAIGTAAGQGGKLLGTATDNSSAATAFNGKNLYLVIFNTTSAGTATQMGIFQAFDTNLAVVFPTNNSGFQDTITVSMNDSGILAVGGVGSTSVSPQRFILAALVPEPTAFALLVPGVLGILGFHRLRASLR